MEKYFNLFYTMHTIYNFNYLLQKKEVQKIILDAFRFLVNDKRIVIYSFVIMSNHIHYIYHVNEDYTDKGIKHSFLSFTAKEILETLSSTEKTSFLVNKTNRIYQIWKAPSLSVKLFSDKFLVQKMNYIHNNPLAAGLVDKPEDYHLSSFKSYLNNESDFNFLTLW